MKRSGKMISFGYNDFKVELIDQMGDDASCINAARVSFDKEVAYEIEELTSVSVDRVGRCIPNLNERDSRLIKFLARENHVLPFCHAFASFRIKAPIFVARQLGKHQVGLSWNEVSRRYVDSQPLMWMPDMSEGGWRARAKDKKQGSSDEVIEDGENLYIKQKDAYDTFIKEQDEQELAVIDILRLSGTMYEKLIAEGVCPEQARTVLPQSMFTEWIWSGSLLAFARVYNLRAAPDTQEETRHIAKLIGEKLATFYPNSWKALTNG